MILLELDLKKIILILEYTIFLSSPTDATTELKTSVSNGKSAIAAAVTDKGVNTAASDSFDTMANNIRSISMGLNVYSSNITSYYSWSSYAYLRIDDWPSGYGYFIVSLMAQQGDYVGGSLSIWRYLGSYSTCSLIMGRYNYPGTYDKECTTSNMSCSKNGFSADYKGDDGYALFIPD